MKTNMEWEQIDKLLKEQIEERTDINIGYEQIKQILIDNNLPAVNIDVNGLKKEFDEWLSEVLDKEPIPGNIKSVYFGLATMTFPEIDNGNEKTTIYIAGSILTPTEDADWACDTEYLPNRRYVLLDEFEKIDETIKKHGGLSGDYEVLVFNGLLNLLVMSSQIKFKTQLLTYKEKKLGFFKTDKKRETLHFGTGYDSGDVYLLGELKNE